MLNLAATATATAPISSLGKKRARSSADPLPTVKSETSSRAESQLPALTADDPPRISPSRKTTTTTGTDEPGSRPPAGSGAGAAVSSSSFRNVSACNRCRLRKNRCDQRLPRCQLCQKARVRCVGYDPITKQEIPRSYVYFLESRVAYLEKLCIDRSVEFKKAVAFDEDEAIKIENGADHGPPAPGRQGYGIGSDGVASVRDGGTSEKDRAGMVGEKERSGARELGDGHAATRSVDGERDHERESERRLDNLVSNIGLVSVQGTSDPRYLGSTSGISFARVVFAAVKSSVSGNGSERAGGAGRPKENLSQSAMGTGTSTMRDSFFGLQTRPTMKCAGFPDRELAEKLVDLYFEHANPQMPILHRGDFMELLDRTYSAEEKDRSPRGLYLLNIVFAIGAGIIFEDKQSVQVEGEAANGRRGSSSSSASGAKRQKLSNYQYQPEEYHASAIVHLESFLGSSSANEGFGGLEELQAVLLLASFALLRPVAPGLWYIVGVAMRLAVDLGLHYEDGTGIDSVTGPVVDGPSLHDENTTRPLIDSRERARREWVRDLRRRLWWCVYSFDRLVATCVGRPFGIADSVITTDFPSLLDDKYITKAGFVEPAGPAPSYKRAAHHYFKLRLLQSEIQDVLQYQQARFARQRGCLGSSAFLHPELSSPFLQAFDSFRAWRRDVHRRLDEWKDGAPSQQETGVRFPVGFLELNYWQAVITLYRQSLTVPIELAGELTPVDEVSSPSFSNVEEAEDEDEIYLKVAEAGQKVLRIYRQMHHVRLVNYTYLATHHLFMAGISFLYAIWHSPLVRSRLSLDDVDFTVLAATSVLADLTHKCPPAEACKDALERMSKATVQMCLSTTGFGSQVDMTRTSLMNNATPRHGPRLQPIRPRPPDRYHSMDSHRQKYPPGPPSRPIYGASSPSLAERSRQPMQSYARAEYADPNYPSDQRIPRPGIPQRSQSLDYLHRYDNTSPPRSQQQQQPQPQYYYPTSPQSTSPGGSVATLGYRHDQAPNHGQSGTLYSQSGESDHTQQHQPTTLMSLDFLDLDSSSAGLTTTDNLVGMEGLTEEYSSTTAAAVEGFGSGGIDLGFGMAVDFHHDWSETANLDLLEGYFFGGSGGGPVGGGGGEEGEGEG